MAEPRRVCPSCGKSYAAAAVYCPGDGTRLPAPTPDPADPYIGLEVAGQFELRELVGTGSMARVYRAHQRELDRDVAVKVLHRDLTNKEPIVTRFYREAKVAGRLSHPNVVHVLFAGALPDSPPRSHGEPFVVFEFLDGVSLSAALAAEGGALPLARALHVILSVCDAIGEAHARGVVHRDLKPENVMLVARGDDPDFVKVVDFGAARADWAPDSVETRAGSVLGTALYVSPEGARGQRVDARADVYSIATLLFRCLAGSTPFTAQNPVSVLIAHTRQAPPDVRSFASAAAVPDAIARLLHENLAKDPAERCPDARAFGHALVEAAAASGLELGPLLSRATLLGRVEARGRPHASRLSKWALPAAIALSCTMTTIARASDDEFEYLEPDRHDDRAWYGMAEFALGVLTLPTAEVCVERAAAGCKNGDLSLAVSARPLFRRGNFAIGAGVVLAPITMATAPRDDPEGFPRDHNRTYFTGEVVGRYYVPLTETLDLWFGPTAGFVIINDSFQTKKDLKETAIPGPRGATILTEGFALGVATGVAMPVADNWLLGGGLRFSNWFLPEDPATDSLGDTASLHGNVINFDVGVSLAYRSRLVF